jgi:hypothetical protein
MKTAPEPIEELKASSHGLQQQVIDRCHDQDVFNSSLRRDAGGPTGWVPLYPSMRKRTI